MGEWMDGWINRQTDVFYRRYVLGIFDPYSVGGRQLNYGVEHCEIVLTGENGSARRKRSAAPPCAPQIPVCSSVNAIKPFVSLWMTVSCSGADFVHVVT